MSGLINGYSADPTVNDALDIIEEGLRVAFLEATERINAALAGPGTDKRALHSHASDLHSMLATMDRNAERRREQVGRF